MKRIILLLIIITVSFNKQTNISVDNYLAVIVDGVEESSIPLKGSYNINVNCINAEGFWDYEDWSLNLINIKDKAKCTLIFTSMTPVKLTDYIKNLDNLSGVYNEPSTDYRYEGDDPDNYVLFNNELWRIIGVFADNSHGKTNKKLVKIIKNDSLAALSWNKEDRNDWATSSLYTLLNEYYYNAASETTLNYCYQWSNIIKGNCNFNITGIKNNYRNMIENVTWKLGASNQNLTAPEFYNIERGNITYESNAKEISGYIGLIYPSDYGYSVLENDCPRTTQLTEYNTTLCGGSSYLRGKSYEWTLTSSLNDADDVFRIDDDGRIGGLNVHLGYSLRPVLYLKENNMKIAGSGTINNPYIITN